MKVIENTNCFGGRLYDSFKEKGFDLKSDNGKNSSAMKKIIADMIDKKLITEDQKEKYQKQIRKDLKETSATPNIDSATLKFYCDYLQVSADYLLGFIEKPLSDSGLSPKAITRLKNMDSDSRELFNAMVEGRYIKNLSSSMRSFYAIGNAIHISANNQEDKKNYSKAIENIKINMLRDSGADFIHKLAYDKKVFNHFMDNAVEDHNQNQKDFYKGYSADFLKGLEQSQKEFKKNMLAIYDEMENNTNTK